MSAPDLARTQRLLWDLITAPQGAGPGARALHRDGRLADPSLRFLVRQHGALTPVQRVDVYANMYFYRLRDCLAEDYPALAAQLGPERFHNLVTDYLLAHPSTHYSLRELGRALPGFLAHHALSRSHPLAPDLAALEWARVDVFDETDAEPLARETILARGQAEPETFRVRLVPATRLLRVAPGVLRAWRAARAEGGREAPPRAIADAGPLAVRVWRRGFSVWHQSIEPDEEACLAELAGPGAGLGELGEILLAHRGSGEDAERAMQRLAELLETWAAEEILTAAR